MRRYKIIISMIMMLVLVTSSIVYAASDMTVATKVDKNGFYPMTITKTLNLKGETALTVPFDIVKYPITSITLANGTKAVVIKTRNAGKTLYITPTAVTPNTVYTLKVTLKNKSKYMGTIKSQVVATVPTTPLPNKTTNPTKDALGYTILSVSDALNPCGETIINMPSSINPLEVQAISLFKNGALTNGRVYIKDKKIVITPKSNFEPASTYTMRIFAKSNRYTFNLKTSSYDEIARYGDGVILKYPAKPSSGFNYPYYLYLPNDIKKNNKKYMMVEPNNTGRVSDSLMVHDENALYIVSASSYPAHTVANELNIPMLVPVFPRPLSDWHIYTHDLDRNTMLIKSGDMKRLDLQLIAMIKDAQQSLASQGIKVETKVFMNGYSASAKFVNKFTAIHPEMVKAVTTGGVNAYTILPTSSYKGTTLNYPNGVADLQELTGKTFNETEYKKVAQFIYMGEQDNNDIISAGFDGDEIESIKSTARSILGENMMPDRWNKLQAIYKELGYDKSIQFHTYKGIGHAWTQNSIDDMVKFFKANTEDVIKKITPHSNAF